MRIDITNDDYITLAEHDAIPCECEEQSPFFDLAAKDHFCGREKWEEIWGYNGEWHGWFIPRKADEDDCECEDAHWPHYCSALGGARRVAPPPPRSTECPHPPKTARALAWALEGLGLEVRHNLRRHASEYRKDGSDWQQFTGRAIAYYTSEIEEAYTVKGYRDLVMPLKFGRDAFVECLDALLYNLEVDPFLDYLNDLPEPSGRRILPSLLTHCFNVADGQEELAAWVPRAILVGAVMRAYEPGTKFDEMPILVGPGGIGKTMFLQEMVPQHIPGLYGSGLDLSGDPKAKVEALQGKCIIECGEMVGAGKGDIGKIKDFISRVDDGSVRLSYRKDPELSPRRCVIVGTADRDKFLPPDRNPRRFVPVTLTGGKASKVLRHLRSNRDRVWGEAKEMYHKGIQPRLPDALKDVAAQAAFKAMQE